MPGERKSLMLAGVFCALLFFDCRISWAELPATMPPSNQAPNTSRTSTAQFAVDQIRGSCQFRRKSDVAPQEQWQELSIGSTVPFDSIVHTDKQSYLSLRSPSGKRIRLWFSSAIELSSNESIKLLTGSALLQIPRESKTVRLFTKNHYMDVAGGTIEVGSDGVHDFINCLSGQKLKVVDIKTGMPVIPPPIFSNELKMYYSPPPMELTPNINMEHLKPSTKRSQSIPLPSFPILGIKNKTEEVPATDVHGIPSPIRKTNRLAPSIPIMPSVPAEAGNEEVSLIPNTDLCKVDLNAYIKNEERFIKRYWLPPRQNKSLTTVFEVQILASGWVQAAEIIKGSGDTTFDEAALSAVKNFKADTSCGALPAGSPPAVNFKLTFESKPESQ